MDVEGVYILVLSRYGSRESRTAREVTVLVLGRIPRIPVAMGDTKQESSRCRSSITEVAHQTTPVLVLPRDTHVSKSYSRLHWLSGCWKARKTRERKMPSQGHTLSMDSSSISRSPKSPACYSPPHSNI